MKNYATLAFSLAFSAFVFSSQATVILDFRPEVGDAPNPGDGTTRINVTSGSNDNKLIPTEVALPIFAPAVRGSASTGIPSRLPTRKS